jgi:ammonium transporter, Amt family
MSMMTLVRKTCAGRFLVAAVLLVVLTPALRAQPSTGSAMPSDSDRLAKVEQQVTDAKSSADNAWMLTSAALVLMMTGPGLALFYGGLVRKKNVLSTMMQSFAMMALISVLWAL